MEMSQSEAHKTLVKGVGSALCSRFENISILVDLQQNPGDEVPPKIGRFRPDVYATRRRGHFIVVIAEAKTDEDIDNQHTHDQVISFIKYLNRSETSIFILAVTGYRADRAKTFLRFIRKELEVVSVEIEVFDGCDFWRLDSSEGISWHLC